MFKVRIEYHPDKKTATVQVNYRRPGQIYGKTRTEEVSAPFGLVKPLARTTAKRMVKEWRKELATTTYDEYEVTI